MLASFKKSFAPANGFIRLNNSGLAPISLPARLAVETWVRRLYEDGDRCYPDSIGEIESTRAELARFLNAKPAEVAFFGSTANAISQVAIGFPLKPGDEVVVWDQEYPSNFYPWKVATKRARAKLIVARSTPELATPTDAMMALTTEKTKIMAFSWIQYRTGAIADLGALTSACRARGIFTCADIIQGAGVLPFDFSTSGLDAACGGSHKWLAAPIGVGFLLLKKEHIEKLRPTTVGAMSFGNSEDLSNPTAKLKSDIGRFEPGAKDILALAGFGASLRLFNSTGITAIHTEAAKLSGQLRSGIEGLGYHVNSPKEGVIVNFSPTANSPLRSIDEILTALSSGQVSFGNRPPGIRLSPHAFNSETEIETVLKILANRSSKKN